MVNQYFLENGIFRCVRVKNTKYLLGYKEIHNLKHTFWNVLVLIRLYITSKINFWKNQIV